MSSPPPHKKQRTTYTPSSSSSSYHHHHPSDKEITSFPFEVLENIFLFIPITSFASINLVCSCFHRAIDTHRYWRSTAFSLLPGLRIFHQEPFAANNRSDNNDSSIEHQKNENKNKNKNNSKRKKQKQNTPPFYGKKAKRQVEFSIPDSWKEFLRLKHHQLDPFAKIRDELSHFLKYNGSVWDLQMKGTQLEHLCDYEIFNYSRLDYSPISSHQRFDQETADNSLTKKEYFQFLYQTMIIFPPDTYVNNMVGLKQVEENQRSYDALVMNLNGAIIRLSFGHEWAYRGQFVDNEVPAHIDVNDEYSIDESMEENELVAELESVRSLLGLPDSLSLSSLNQFFFSMMPMSSQNKVEFPF